MGLPQIQISFENKKDSFIRRLGRGIVAYVVVGEGNDPASVTTYSDIKDALTANGEPLKEQLTRMFEYGCKKVLLVKATTFTAAEDILKRAKYNYLVVDEAQSQEAITWAKTCEFRTGRNFILISDGATTLAAKNDRVVCTYPYVSTGIKLGTPADLAAICAGNNDKRSATYFVLAQDATLTDEDLNKYPNRPTADAETDKGHVVMFDDGSKVKVGRAVTTLYADKAEKQDRNPFYKIRLVDSMNTIEDDIRDTFENEYVGKVLNSYENKMAFIGALNSIYFRGLEGELLEANAVNRVDVDVEKHIELAKAEGKDVASMSEMDIRTYDTGESLYLAGTLRLVDTMEDLHIRFTI